MDFKVQVGINAEHREDAARLYAIAFRTKFLKIFGDTEDVVSLMKDGIDLTYAISAVSIPHNELLGIAGFRLNNSSLTNLSIRMFMRQFGIFRGGLKYVMSAVLFHRSPDKKKQLLMDGIAVKEGNRGRGIGKKLFEELENFARIQKMPTIKLDVIDENPKAKKLYENIGFVETKYQKVPQFIFNLIGVSGVTTMEKTLNLS